MFREAIEVVVKVGIDVEAASVDRRSASHDVGAVATAGPLASQFADIGLAEENVG